MLEGERQTLVGRRRAHRVVCGECNGPRLVGSLIDSDEAVALLLEGVLDATGLEGALLALLLGEHELGARYRGEIPVVLAQVAQLGVLGNRGKLLVLRVIAVEQLVLAIRADEAAKEREHEHERKDDEACHGHAVAQESLDHQRRG